MTLYYSLVFLLLTLEALLFVLLVIPLPYVVRRKIFTFLSENPLVAKVQYGLKITFIFVLILFIDSCNRVYRVGLEMAVASEGSHNTARSALVGHERLEVQVRKFYSQRNMYLCGSTIFLSLILNRFYVMILEILRLEQQIKESQGTAVKDPKLVVAGEPGEIARLKKEIERKDKNIEALKQQASGLHREWDSLGEKFAATQDDGTPKKTK